MRNSGALITTTAEKELYVLGLLLLLAAAVGARPLALDDVQHLTLDVDADGVCPERPVKLTVSGAQDRPTDLLAFQANWNPATLRLEDMQRALPFAPRPSLPSVARPARTTLPVLGLQGVSRLALGQLALGVPVLHHVEECLRRAIGALVEVDEV